MERLTKKLTGNIGMFRIKQINYGTSKGDDNE